MRSANRFNRFSILLGSFFAGLLFDRLCTALGLYTYYLPAQPPTPWYDTLLEMIVITGFGGLIMLLPVLIGLFKSAFNKEKTS